MNRLRCLCVFIGVIPGFAWPAAAAAAEGPDRVEQLEQRVMELEQQLNELKGLLQEAKTEAEAAPGEATPAPAPHAAPAAEEEKPGLEVLGEGTLRVGGDIRFRGLYFDNLWDFEGGDDSDQREVFRFRPRVFFDWNPNDRVEGYVRLTKEWFYGMDEEFPGYDVEGKDAMFDNAWGEAKDIFNTGLTARVGRQDLVYGEGFVLLDGTPFDGSQTISFDAAKLVWEHGLGATDFIYAKPHENDFSAADDEDLYGVYNRWRHGNWGIEPYLLYRDKNLDSIDGVNPPAVFDPSPAEQTLLAGARATAELGVADGVTLALAAEGGKEWGKVDFAGMDALPPSLQFSRNPGSGEVDRDAWGGMFHGTLGFEDLVWKPSLKSGVTYVSGDDPNTPDYEGWDDFYAQWPKYSELYVYTLYDGFKGRTGLNDPDAGVWSNMIIPEVMLTVRPTDRMTNSLRYLYFLADEDTGPGAGDERGHNLQFLTNYVFNKNLSGHFLIEWFDPGDFYLDDADDALFTRFQILYSF